MKNRNAFLKLFFIVIFLFPEIVLSQVNDNQIEKYGKITFQSSQNIYVRFENTDSIKQGDTLYVKRRRQLLPVIVVKYLSASSCSGENIGKRKLNNGETVIAIVNKRNNNNDQATEAKPAMVDSVALRSQNKKVDSTDVKLVDAETNKKIAPDNNFYGRFSVQSISSLDNSGSANDMQRWRYSFSLRNNESANSPFFFSNYTVFAYTANRWSEVRANLNNSLKIYDLTLGYKPDDKTTLWLGRHLNSKIGNIGATDGLQIERKFGDFYGGFVVGSRPNYTDYSYNIKLFEYGGYLGLSNRKNDSYVENVIGAFQQTNNGKVDRRFLYFQHSDNLISKTNLFLSTEVDLYKKERNVGKSTFSLTSLYLSLRVAPSRVFSVTTTYDARRNVVYYETYKFLIDTLFQNELRQGLRVNTNFRPVDNLFIGLNAGYKFRSGDVRPSRNYGGYISYSDLPFFDITPSLNFTKIMSSYVDGTDFGGRLSKYLSNGMYISAGYRKVQYQFTAFSGSVKQDIFTADLSVPLFRKLSLSIDYEGVFENTSTFSRFFIDLTTRF